jgi:hypothetical protein
MRYFNLVVPDTSTWHLINLIRSLINHLPPADITKIINGEVYRFFQFGYLCDSKGDDSGVYSLKYYGEAMRALEGAELGGRRSWILTGSSIREREVVVIEVRPRSSDSVQLDGICKNYFANYIFHLIVQLKEIYPGTMELTPVGVKKEESLTWKRKDNRGRKPGITEWRVERANLFKSIKMKKPTFSKRKVAIRAQNDEYKTIYDNLRASHPKWNQETKDKEAVKEFKKKWRKDYFSENDVKNDYDVMGWDWS